MHRRRHVVIVEFRRALQMAVAHRAAGIVKAHKRSYRHLRIWRYPTARRAIRRRFDSRGERGADTSFTVCVAEPTHLQIRERYELGQMISGVIESFRVIL